MARHADPQTAELTARRTVDAPRARGRTRAPIRPACAAAVLGAALTGGAASAEPPTGNFGGVGIAFGTSGQPSDCSYCDRVWGPALEGTVGWMIRDSLGVRSDGWIYVSGDGLPSAGAMMGPQLWLGDGLALHAALGLGVYWTDNSDGGPGLGGGVSGAITGSYQLWRREAVSADLQLRGMVLWASDLGFVTFAFAGYAVRWD